MSCPVLSLGLSPTYQSALQSTGLQRAWLLLGTGLLMTGAPWHEFATFFCVLAALARPRILPGLFRNPFFLRGKQLRLAATSSNLAPRLHVVIKAVEVCGLWAVTQPRSKEKSYIHPSTHRPACPARPFPHLLPPTADSGRWVWPVSNLLPAAQDQFPDMPQSCNNKRSISSASPATCTLVLCETKARVRVSKECSAIPGHE
jgi:hypothetical protein